MQGRRLAVILAAASSGVALGAASFLPHTPAFVVNASPSIPPGLYRIEQAPARRGDILVIRPQGALALILEQQGLAAPRRLLLKPLAGLPGDTVCRQDEAITLNGVEVAIARTETDAQAPLPVWTGCRRLLRSERFVLSPHPRSFDSRYFGPVDAAQVIGLARPVFVFASPEGRL